MGPLFYVVGASGVGKDSLLAYARAKTSARPETLFAHRYITRPIEAGGESHVALSRSEFSYMKARGLFALDWESHGLCYGIGVEVNRWLESGARVVMNGSRGHLATAARHFPTLCVVHIQSSTAILRARLEARGRESPAEIEERLARATQFVVDHPGTRVITNNGSLAEAGNRLLSLLQSSPAAPSTPRDVRPRSSDRESSLLVT